MHDSPYNSIEPVHPAAGARLNLVSLRVDGSRYWEWWFKTYGDEAVAIARAFVADLPSKASRP